MRAHGSLNRDKDANAAASEAVRGVAIGAAQWSLPMLLLSGAGQALSPVYKGLTIQFKVFLVMGGMLLGGWIEGDRRLRLFEERERVQRKLVRNEALRREWELEAEAVGRRRQEEQARLARERGGQ